MVLCLFCNSTIPRMRSLFILQCRLFTAFESSMLIQAHRIEIGLILCHTCVFTHLVNAMVFLAVGLLLEFEIRVNTSDEG